MRQAQRQAARESYEARKQQRAEQAARKRETQAQWEASVQSALGKSHVVGLDESIRKYFTDDRGALFSKLPPQDNLNRSERISGEFKLLLHAVEKEAPRLLTPEYVGAMFWLAKQPWLRLVEEWEPVGKGRDSQFTSLCKHLLAKYPIPGFIWSAFFADHLTAEKLGPVVAEIAAGGSLYKIVQAGKLTIPLTRKMCHEILQPRSGMNFMQMVRSVQTKTVQGSRRLFEVWMNTDAGRQIHSSEDEAFWLTVLTFLAQNPMLEPGRIGPIVDYVRFRRAEEPGFSMKGRSVLALLRSVSGWHGQLRAARKVGTTNYAPSGFKSFEQKVKYRDSAGNHRISTWRVHELLTEKDLYNEGVAMRHCVHSYGRSIESKMTSIWSVTLDDEKMLTVEVRNQARQVVQTRGALNRMPTKPEFQTVSTWANLNHLSVSVGTW